MNDCPIVCEECDVVLEQHSGYTATQYGICDDCLAKVETLERCTGLDPVRCDDPKCKVHGEQL